MPTNRNRNRICGKNTSTDPTPPQTPSTSRLRIIDSGNACPTHTPEASIHCSTPSISGCANEKIDWKTASTTSTKIAGPAIG